jgi:hypothetical protein
MSSSGIETKPLGIAIIGSAWPPSKCTRSHDIAPPDSASWGFGTLPISLSHATCPKRGQPIRAARFPYPEKARERHRRSER